MLGDQLWSCLRWGYSMFSQQIGNINITWDHTYWIRIFEDGDQKPGQSLQKILKPTEVCEGLVSNTLKSHISPEKCLSFWPLGSCLRLLDLSFLVVLVMYCCVTHHCKNLAAQMSKNGSVSWLNSAGKVSLGVSHVVEVRWWLGWVIWMIYSTGSPRFLLHSHAWHWTEMASTWLGISM